MGKVENREYSVDEAVHSPDIYDVINAFDFDIPFWLEHARKACGPVLEFCCGTGRITVPLVKAGIPVVGADSSEKMLEGFMRRATREGVSVETRHADIRDFSFSEKFSLIFVPFNSFQCLYSLSDVQAALASIRRHLAPSGRFILDVFNPSIELMVDRSRAEQQNRSLELPGRGTVEWFERCHYDAAAQVNRVTWTFVFADGTREIQHLDMRCFYPQELELLLKASGFRIEERLGTYDGSPFSSQSPKQILICCNHF